MILIEPKAHLDRASSTHNPSQPDSGCKFRVGRVADIILHQIPPQPVGEVEEAAIKGDKNVSNKGGHLWQDPTLHLGPGLANHHCCLPFVFCVLHRNFYSASFLLSVATHRPVT